MVGCSPNSKGFHIYNGSAQRVVDCGGTFAPVCCISRQRLFVTIATDQNRDVFDVQTAFLHFEVDEEVYIKTLPRFQMKDNVTGDPLVMKLKKSF